MKINREPGSLRSIGVTSIALDAKTKQVFKDMAAASGLPISEFMKSLADDALKSGKGKPKVSTNRAIAAAIVCYPLIPMMTATDKEVGDRISMVEHLLDGRFNKDEWLSDPQLAKVIELASSIIQKVKPSLKSKPDRSICGVCHE